MKSGWKIIMKLGAIVLLLCITPFSQTLWDTLAKADIKSLAYKPNQMEGSISLKDELNVMSYHKNENLHEDIVQVETTQENEVVIPEAKEEKKTTEKKTTDNTNTKKATGKTVYIYDTHQEEQYADGKTVMDAAANLGEKLEKKGIKVVLETHDFPKYLNQQHWDYEESYRVSYKYLQDALVNYGGFDLCIDLHRDSIPRNVSILETKDKTYAKAMMVVGNLGKNAKTARKTSSTLTDIMNDKVDGIMRSVMEREAYYNQEVAKNIVLIEVGAEVNTFEEVKNTTDVLANGIYELLNGG